MRRQKSITRYPLVILVALAVGLISFAKIDSPQAQEIEVNGTVSVCFSPLGGCEEMIVREMNKAKSEILVMAYTFTSKGIASALIKANKRGVKTEIVLDKKANHGDRYSAADFTAHMGIPTYLDGAHKIMHSKVIAIDKETIITGSYNFSRAAINNAENVIVIRSKELARAYIDNYSLHKGHSEPYQGR